MISHALTRSQRLSLTIAISFSFFVAEIATGFYTRSLALVADAFHYLNDLIGFVVALVALQAQIRGKCPPEFSFGWARAPLLGAFFNGVFLLALGISIFLQSVERFISIQRVQNPLVVLIIGCVGLALNIISAAFLHEHDHDHSHHHVSSDDGSDERVEGTQLPSLDMYDDHAQHMHHTAALRPPGHDLGMLGVITHVLGDALNNIAVIIAALLIWLLHSDARFYADPAIGAVIALTILASAVPLTKRSGAILLQSAPPGVRLDDVKHDLEMVPGVQSVHELHVWRLDQRKVIASAHVVVANDQSLAAFMRQAQTVAECLHAYGIHSATLQPELMATTAVTTTIASTAAAVTATTGGIDIDGPSTAKSAGGGGGGGLRIRSRGVQGSCRLACGNVCEPLMCCN